MAKYTALKITILRRWVDQGVWPFDLKMCGPVFWKGCVFLCDFSLVDQGVWPFDVKMCGPVFWKRGVFFVRFFVGRSGVLAI